TGPEGKVMVIGMGTSVYTLPVSAAALREVDLLGSFRYANTYPAAMEVLSTDSDEGLAFSKLITHQLDELDATEDALSMACKKEE
ncbi:hypothetical protein AOQ84DRAFT_250899, partial [Glonium stellatum]